LGLGRETDGFLAWYEVGGEVAQLLLVQYPDAEAASAGLATLEGDQVNELVSADAHVGRRLTIRIHGGCTSNE
jgi:hypothetical protein